MGSNFPDSFTSPITQPVWTSSNITFSDGKVSKSNAVGDYDSVGFFSLPSVNGTTIKGYYSTVKFSDTGYAYAGLTTSMTTTDPVAQYLSKIDAGFKNETGTIMIVRNGAESYPIGDNTSTYSILYDGRDYIYYKDGVIVHSSFAGVITSGMNVGIAIYDGQNIDITGGTYSGSKIENVSPVSITEVSQTVTTLSVTVSSNGMPQSYNIKLLNEQGVIQDTFSFSYDGSSVFSIAVDTLTNFPGASNTYKFVAEAVYINTTVSSGEYIFTLADLRPSIVAFTQTDKREFSVEWTPIPGADSYLLYIGKYDVSSATYINITGSPFVISGTNTHIQSVDFITGEQYNAYLTATSGTTTIFGGNSAYITIQEWRAPFGVKNISVDTVTIPGQAIISWENDDSVGEVVPENHSILLLDNTDAVFESYDLSNSAVTLTTNFTTDPVNIAKIRITAINSTVFNVSSDPTELVGPWIIAEDNRPPFGVKNISVDTVTVPGQAVISWENDDSVGEVVPENHSILLLDNTDAVFESYDLSNSAVTLTTNFTTDPIRISKIRITAINNSVFNLSSDPTELVGPWFATIYEWRPPFGVKNISVDTVTVPGQAVISWENDDSVGEVVPENHRILLLDDADNVLATYISGNSDVTLTTDFTTYPVNIAKIRITAINNPTFDVSSDPVDLVGPWLITEDNRAPFGVKNISVDTVTVPGQAVISWENDDSVGEVVPENHIVLLLDDVDDVIQSYDLSNSDVTLTTGFKSYPVNIAKIRINAINNLISYLSSDSVDLVGPWSITQGDGGGGGGGNNGGNGHNNMATLTFNPAFTVNASDSTSVTVYGETAVERNDYTDELAVSVSAATLNDILSFSKAGEEAATDFTIDLTGISAAVKTALESRLQSDHARPSLADMGIDARSILSVTHGSWTADDTALKVADTTEAARNVYEQAADKGKLSASEGKLNLAVGETFMFYMDTSATQSIEITIDSGVFTGASTSDVAPLIPVAALFGGSNAAGDKGVISKSWDYKFKVTVTATA